MIRIEVVGNAITGLAKAAAEVQKQQEKALSRVAFEIQREAKKNVRQNFKAKPMLPGETGGNALARSINVVKSGVLHYEIGSNLIYARMKEYGGVILPKRKKFLSWWTTDALQGVSSWKYSKKGVNANIGAAAHRVFAKRVVQKGRPYLMPAAQAVNIPKNFAAVLNPWLDNLGR